MFKIGQFVLLLGFLIFGCVVGFKFFNHQEGEGLYLIMALICSGGLALLVYMEQQAQGSDS